MVPIREVIVLSAALLLLPVSVSGADEWKETRVLGEAGFQHAGTLDDIVPLPDGKRVLTSSRDGATRLWDLESGKLLRRYQREDGGDVWGLLLLPGGKEFLSAAEHGVVSRWEVDTGKELMTYQHEGTVFRLALHPEGERFVATDNKKLVIMWELKTGNELKRFVGHGSSVYTAAFVSGGDKLVTGGSDGKLKVWDTATAECEKTLGTDFEDLYTIALSPDRKRFATCSEDEFVRVYDADTVAVVWETKLDSEVNVVAWSPDGKTLAGAGQDEKIYFFDAANGKELQKFSVPGGDHQPVAFTPDGRELLTGGDQQLFRWDWEEGKRIKPGLGYSQLGTSGDLVAVTADGGLAVAGGSDEDAVIWDTATGELIRRHSFPNKVSALAASPVGSAMAAGTSGAKVHLLDAATGRAGAVFSGAGMRGSVVAVAFDGKGTRLAGATSDEEGGYLWDVASGTTVSQLEGHGDDINGLAVSVANDSIATVADDKTVRLWDGVTGGEIQKLRFGADDPEHVAFFGNGRGLLASSGDKDLLGWIGEERKEEPKIDREQVTTLLGELGANRFAERKAAIDKLVAQGPDILPLLDAFESDDPEVVYRLREIREKIRRTDVGSEMETLHSFDANVQGLAGNPVTGEWAAVVGYGVRARIVVGGIDGQKLVISQEWCSGRAPEAVSFSADGGTLVAVNGDGTVSVLRK